VAINPIHRRLAGQLHAESKNLESLTALLSVDPAVVNTHILALQDIDRIAQILAAIGDALGSNDPEASCRHSGLEKINRLALPEF
jgi:hypothetical protein